jgi:type IX secretion system PorP/SprF family membrane protein
MRLLHVIILAVFIPLRAFSQDPQVSQNYAMPLNMNPAFAGISNNVNVNLLHRNQWPNLTSNYQFSAISVDIGLEKYKSGLGLLITSDSQFSALTTNSVSLQYAYHLSLNENYSLSMGMQGSYVNRSLSPENLVFGDQFDGFLGSGSINATSTDIIPQTPIFTNPSYVDLSVGSILYSKKHWIGISAHHLNQPNQSLVSNSTSALDMKLSLQMGTKIELGNSSYEGNDPENALNYEKSISPIIHFKKQGVFNQLDVGTYLTFAPLVLGVWYRNFPIGFNNPEKLDTQESMTGLIGFRKDKFSIGYSYDFTLSKLSPTGGAHEITLSYVFGFNLFPNKYDKSLSRSLACPKF